MNDNIWKIQGVKQLGRSLGRLPEEMAKAAERSALREGGKEILQHARSFATRSQDKGLLKESLGITVRKTRRYGLTARVGARTGFGRTVIRGGIARWSDPVKYAHLVEYGTSRSPAKPYIAPAVAAARNQIVNALARGYSKGLDRAVRRARRK